MLAYQGRPFYLILVLNPYFSFSVTVLPLQILCRIAAYDSKIQNPCETFKNLNKSVFSNRVCIIPGPFSCQKPKNGIIKGPFSLRLFYSLNSVNCQSTIILVWWYFGVLWSWTGESIFESHVTGVVWANRIRFVLGLFSIPQSRVFAVPEWRLKKKEREIYYF